MIFRIDSLRQSSDGGRVMTKTKQAAGKLSVALAGIMCLASGCQTWVPEAGLTLPSGDYLKHPPQYFPPSPPFPLPRESLSLEKAAQKAQDERPLPGAP